MLYDVNYKSDYVNFVSEMIVKGYVWRVFEDIELRVVWYIFYYCIYYIKKFNKICVVFYCSVKFGGILLNDWFI